MPEKKTGAETACNIHVRRASATASANVDVYGELMENAKIPLLLFLGMITCVEGMASMSSFTGNCLKKTMRRRWSWESISIHSIRILTT